jgi:oxygen-independent coproporphyrinogen-3 oxidase
LYVHVPFCVGKCRYCDFYSVTFSADSAGEFVNAAAAELAVTAECLDPPLASVFVGGGTPTVLGPALAGSLLSLVDGFIDSATEFTVEANPCTVSREIADVLAAAGVNRVTLGVQSFHRDELALLGRRHVPQQIRKATSLLRQAGITNIGYDLIYAIPGQTPASWRSSLDRALELAPAHLSCYALSFEAGTPLADDLLAGRVREMDEADQKACYDTAIEAALGAGMEYYEISNFARPAMRCRHNLTYWHNEPYLGIGPAAASYVAGARRTNAPDLPAYVAALRDGRPPPATVEKLSGRQAMAEALMLGLRLTQGVARKDFKSRYGQDPVAAFPQSIGRYVDLGAMAVSARSIQIAREYLFVADTILADILAEA